VGVQPGPLDAPEIAEWLLPLAEAGAGRKTGPKRVGGKAATLGRLIREGFPVPRGWVIDARRFERDIEGALPRGHDIATLIKLAHTKAGVDRAARARDHILGLTLPAGLQHALEVLWKEMEGAAPWGFAARSSATCEDMEDTSLAGVATTVLGVRGPAQLGDAVRTVWASAYLPRALAYLAHAGVRELGMAVVLQLVVHAEAAGVLFTAPPPGLEGEHWPRDERLVNATLGLGAPVVEGAAAADMVRLLRDGGTVSQSVIADKRRALVVGPDGVMEVDVPEGQARAPALSRAVLHELGALATRLEERAPTLFKSTRAGPLDVEFAVESEGDGAAGARPGEATARVWLLQARPITGGGFPEGGDADTVWSRANVGEALPGAATPLTWSIARAFSDKGFNEAFTALGCKVPRGAPLVGNVQGRFYLNLSAFMAIAAQVPFLGPRVLLTASGGANEVAIAALERQIHGVSHGRFLLRLPFTAPRQLARQARLEGEVAAFEAEIERARRGLFDLDLGLLPDDGLATTLRSAVALLDRTGTLMLACASASLASHLGLCRLLTRASRQYADARGGAEGDRVDGGAAWGAAEPIAQALVGGARELDSANPGIALAKVAEVVRLDPEAEAQILAGAVHRLDDLPDGSTRRAIDEFLELYGDRAVREAELCTPRWREDPAHVIAMLVSTLRAPPSDPEKALARARALADREVARLETRVSAVELGLIRALVTRTQRFTRLRERMRTWVTRVLGMIRTIALDVDRRLRRIDPTLAPGSVFFCTYDELVAALRSGRAEVGHVVRLRRAEHARDAARPDPPPTFIGRPPPVQLPPVPGTRLTGLPASAGVVEGRARVLEPGAVGLDEVEAGDILVSRTTDVGLSPLFLVAAAVVTELGGPLSHAAVVAREYGIPAVVNVAGATVAIRTGDRLRVDGDRGVVERLDDRPAPSLFPPPEPEGLRPA
jgi:pyruvate,water dikinase